MVNSQARENFTSVEYDIKGYLEYEYRYFPQNDNKKIASKFNHSISTSFDLFVGFTEDDLFLIFTPFLRLDQKDPARTILDINEFYLAINKSDWELKIGSKQLFWGVLESNHLVDIVNQTNAAENIDLEDKLGQPMLNFTMVSEWGVFDVFLLAMQRKRRFSSEEGRPHTGFEPFLKNGAFDDRGENFDYIFRYENSGTLFDLGLYYFEGLARSPIFISENPETPQDSLVAYPKINQFAADLQITLANTLLKFEGLYRKSRVDDNGAFGIGFEHTLYGIFGSNNDLGVLAEYHWDSRDSDTVFQFSNDLFFGLRLNTNQAHDGQILLGILNSLDNCSSTAFIEGSMRFAKNWKFYFEGRIFSLIDNNHSLSNLSDDSYIQLSLAKFF